ncbi:MAG: DEAD/DEAH box helicase family protein, partial [Zestosphaera sp.]
MSSEELVVRHRGWLSESEFKRLLDVAEYLGREGDELAFRISKHKVVSKRLSLDEVLGILDEVGVGYDAEFVEKLKRFFNRSRGSVTLVFSGGKVRAAFERYLGDVYQTHLKEVLRYDRLSKSFYTHPIRYHELKKILTGLGFGLNDLTGFKDSLPLPTKVGFKGSLREYQSEALNAWLNNSGRGIIALPTGSGKTHIGVAALSRVGEATLIITYTKEQLMQWEKFLTSLTDMPQSLIGRYYSRE